MKVAIVSGSWPPSRCGVGDYSACLSDALHARGMTVLRAPTQDVCPPAWRAPAILKRLEADGVDLVHIQYPTMGYGRSLFPSALALASRLPIVVTLHEFSIFRFYRLPWFMPFAACADTVILTSAAEQAAFRRRLPMARARSVVVPIGTNIGRGRASVRDPRALCHFGLLLPGKNIEAFLDLAELLRNGGQAWRLHLIGAIPQEHQAYGEQIVKRARALGMAVHLGLPEADVADLLSSMSAAYLPFPGGATERRGSLLAALANGVRVLAPVGKLTAEWLATRIIDTQSAQDAARLLGMKLPCSKPDKTGPETFGWETIAESHVGIYERAMRKKRDGHHG